jgi:hypothetical protein
VSRASGIQWLDVQAKALDQIAARDRERSSTSFGYFAFIGNQSEEAFGWLDRAYAQRDGGLIGTKVDPLLKSLHNDPRYAALLKKLKFPT